MVTMRDLTYVDYAKTRANPNPYNLSLTYLGGSLSLYNLYSNSL